MEQTKYTLIEDFGTGYKRFGHSELMGRVVGLLLCEVEPLNIDDICEALHVTKTPVTQICRRLEELNLIRRVWVRGERKHHFQISLEVFLQAGVNLTRLYEENLLIAERHLRAMLDRYSAASGEERERLQVVCQRLIHMREFHRRLIDAYNRFIDDWRAARTHLPSVEEYAAAMGLEV